MEYSKLFTDNSIIVKGLTKILDEESITYLVKDRVESSRLAGFGSPDNSVEVHVHSSDLDKALKIIKAYELKIRA
ncbi:MULTISPECIES: putative signal transducing protein [Polaribacter]|jgi:hypothetical protein|uniref:Signal transducing protein n=1 Tax=Polaribacter marinivivus TaxID=1524260 RepID=A0ABV8R7G5_9FLAO|nr:DUF2007 domain-containing protein [uncultured Polaribacter sp.]